MSTWLQGLDQARRARVPVVLVTVTSVRGHAPREAGAKMVVSADTTWSTIGGGNLEVEAIRRSRALLAQGSTELESFVVALSDKAPYRHGVQCCGGEVSVLLEPVPVVPSLALFGMGHVGHELAWILARHDIELHVVDSRAESLSEESLAPLRDAVARVHVHQVPVIPELVLGGLPRGTDVLVMTHDHAEDLAIIDAALRCDHLGTIGVIGSSAKWTRFRAALLEAGLPAAAVDTVVTPVGLPGLTSSKEPAAIAVSVAAAWLHAHDRSRAYSTSSSSS